MGRYLVIYASHFGQTRKIADHIADTLRARGHVAELADVVATSPPPPVSDYDVVVAGSRVELGRNHSALTGTASRSR
jgi:menaquinone-dependent protoporphyrinogen oxidase